MEIVNSCDVYRTEKYANKYNAYTDKGIFMAEYMVLATGGMSQKGLGSDGSGYKIAKKFSHTVTPLHPALVQLKSPGKYCHILKGLRTKCNIKIEINYMNKKERGIKMKEILKASIIKAAKKIASEVLVPWIIKKKGS